MEKKMFVPILETQGMIKTKGCLEVLTAEQILTETRPEYEYSFFTGNYPVYDIEKDQLTGKVKSVLYLGDYEGNPIASALEAVCEELEKNGNYFPPADKVEIAKNCSKVKVDIDDLALQLDTTFRYENTNKTVGYFVVDETNNPSQRAVVEAIWGKDTYQGKTAVKLGKTRFYAEMAKSVQEIASEKGAFTKRLSAV